MNVNSENHELNNEAIDDVISPMHELLLIDVTRC